MKYGVMFPSCGSKDWLLSREGKSGLAWPLCNTACPSSECPSCSVGVTTTADLHMRSLHIVSGHSCEGSEPVITAGSWDPLVYPRTHSRVARVAPVLAGCVSNQLTKSNSNESGGGPSQKTPADDALKFYKGSIQNRFAAVGRKHAANIVEIMDIPKRENCKLSKELHGSWPDNRHKVAIFEKKKASSLISERFGMQRDEK